MSSQRPRWPPLGESLAGVLGQLETWAERHMRGHLARADYDARQ